MIAELTKSAVPKWLVNIIPTSPFPINEVLQGSVYYPASNFDGRPVKYLGGYSHSFVYVDFNVKRDGLIGQLDNFKGYKLAFSRSLEAKDLCFRSFVPIMPTAQDGYPEDSLSYCDGNMFAEWAVYDRVNSYHDDHGPQRFSLLYIGGEGVATFQALYFSNRCAPSAIVLIKSDGFTGNWTAFRDPYKILAKSVMGNPAGQPEYLFIDSLVEPCWPWYSNKVNTIISISEYDGNRHQRIVLWGKRH
jgi:hypothetical protein